MLGVGTKVDNFVLNDAFGNIRSLNEFIGKKVVIFFYAKNNTTGCTKEVCSFNELLAEFKNLNVEVIGISCDSVNSHYKFTKEYGLGVTLLSDQEKTVINYFGVLNVSLSKKRRIGAKRITFILDETLKVIHRFDNVRPANHGREVLNFIQKLNKLS
ncbi:MAG: peroxiredoxin [Acholeplasmataceae bacterium]|nr:peroxiredoxin [Acholeplasmataceae bacterium]